jgi:hypothetical protein
VHTLSSTRDDDEDLRKRVLDDTDTKLCDKIRNVFKKGLPKETDNGINYVLTAWNQNNPEEVFLKVGFTKDTIESRQNRIRNTCNHGSKNQTPHDQARIRLYKAAEALIIADLQSQKHVFDCICRTPHREYFKIPKGVALKVTKRWTSFCQMEPWDATGSLHPFWEERLEKKKATIETKRGGISNRNEVWQNFVCPADYEILWFNFNCFASRLYAQGGLWCFFFLVTIFNLMALSTVPFCLNFGAVFIIMVCRTSHDTPYVSLPARPHLRNKRFPWLFRLKSFLADIIKSFIFDNLSLAHFMPLDDSSGGVENPPDDKDEDVHNGTKPASRDEKDGTDPTRNSEDSSSVKDNDDLILGGHIGVADCDEEAL